MVLGYYLAKAFSYGTPESALVSLPKNCLQGGLSIIIAAILYYALKPAVQNIISPRKKIAEISNEEEKKDIE